MQKYRQILLVGLVSCASAAYAMPSISNVSASPRQNGDVRVRYTLGAEPAVVTFALYDRTSGAKLDESRYNVTSGAVNRLVQPGMAKFIFTNQTGADPANIDVRLRAWPTNCPPDYLVIDLIQPERGARYYTSAEAIPGGVTDVRYKTDYLVLRRIPAAGVTWRMGSPSAELGSEEYRANEQTHLVELTEDYYCAVYPTTYRQTYWLNGKSYTVPQLAPQFNVLNWGWDWPQTDIQYCSYRSWFHESACTYLAGLEEAGKSKYADDTVYKSWPKDGHDIDAAKTPKCAACMSGTYTPVLTTFRANYGFLFDFLTDAQWEFACRGGATNGGHAICDGSDLKDTEADANLSKYGWYANETYGALVTTTNTIMCCLPQPVGGKLPNGYGLYDMHGLVWEQTLDTFSALGNSDTVSVDPVGAKLPNTRGRGKVQRGGAFCTEAKHLRAARRVEIWNTSLVNDRANAKVEDEYGMYKRSKGYRFWLPCHAVR